MDNIEKNMKSLLLVMIAVIFVNTVAQGQITNKTDTIKYSGVRTTKQRIADKKNVWYGKSMIRLNPDSTYEQIDYYSPRKSFVNSVPLTKTGFWIKRKNRIYFYQTRSVIGSDWTSEFIVRGNKLKYCWKRSIQKNEIEREESGAVFDKIFGVKPVIKLVKIK